MITMITMIIICGPKINLIIPLREHRIPVGHTNIKLHGRLELNRPYVFTNFVIVSIVIKSDFKPFPW